MNEAGVVIVGGGYGGGELAVRLRQSGYQGPITLIGAEDVLPYHRPPLSKAYLAGEMAEEALLIRPQAAYEKAQVTVRLGLRVTAIDRAGHTVSLSDGTALPYAHLVLATGGTARPLPCPGGDLGRVFTLRSRADVGALKPHFAAGARLVIVGGGYIGLEVAAVARKHGLEVTVLEAAPRLLARVAGPELAGFFADVHSAAGVTIETGANVVALAPHADDPSRVGEVVLADGRRFAADFVLAGIGLIPAVELARDAGLHVDNGIWVDENCHTEDPLIYAIGDVANHLCPPLGRRVRIESVPNALEQARVAAAAIAGNPAPYAAMPWFWSDQYDLKLQSVGLSEGHDQVVQRGDMAARNFVLFYLREGRVIAADAVNRQADFMMAKKLVANRTAAAADALADGAVPLKTLAV